MRILNRSARAVAVLFVVLSTCLSSFVSCTRAGGETKPNVKQVGENKISSWTKPAGDSTLYPEPKTEREKFLYNLADAAFEQTKSAVVYDPAYVKIDYPNGDVPADRGVCADVVIRAFRVFGIDLQKDVHVDMAAHFALYPKKWGLKKTDTNIDHRRVPNLMKYFERKGKSLPMSTVAADYAPGDIVAYDLNGQGLTHIGIVARQTSEDGSRHLLVHNIGAGPQCEDVLFNWTIIGHYRYFGDLKFSDEKKQKTK